MSYQRILGGINSCLIFIILHGCTTYDAHDNYKESLYSFIGKSIEQAKGFYGRERKWEVITLTNGNQEYRFNDENVRSVITKNFGGLCTTIFEVDAQSRKIIRADFIGGRRECIIPI